jgi:hypothetical protein
LTQALILLQRGAIHRLRDADVAALANVAREHWHAGERIVGSVDPTTDGQRNRELVAGFLRANDQVGGES